LPTENVVQLYSWLGDVSRTRYLRHHVLECNISQ